MTDNNLYRVYRYIWDDGHLYVGKTFKGSKRIGKKSAYKGCILLYNYWNKHGQPKIEILQDNICKGMIQLLEKYYIKKNNSFFDDNKEKGLNLTIGGEFTEMSEETKNHLSKVLKGKRRSEETRKKISENNAMHNPIWREKVSKSLKGKKFTKEHRQHLIGIERNKKKVKQYDINMNFIKEYDNVYIPSKLYNVDRSGIEKCANGKQKTCAGYVWRY